jgi:hypothetical protein
LGGAVASVAPPWFESLFKLGAINYMDVLSVHPYVSLRSAALISTGLTRLVSSSL